MFVKQLVVQIILSQKNKIKKYTTNNYTAKNGAKDYLIPFLWDLGISGPLTQELDTPFSL